MKVTNQESAENLKEIISNTYDFIEQMQFEYLKQSMRTIIDYFNGKADIVTVRKIELKFFALCDKSGVEQHIILDMLEEFRIIHGGEWSMRETKEGQYWNIIYTLSKNNVRLFISAETDFSTSFMVYE